MPKRDNKKKDVECSERVVAANIEVELFSDQTDVSDVENVELDGDVFNVPSSTADLL